MAAAISKERDIYIPGVGIRIRIAKVVLSGGADSYDWVIGGDVQFAINSGAVQGAADWDTTAGTVAFTSLTANSTNYLFAITW